MTANFWQTWKEFEIRHGNEDTIREMLRIKRSVQATYNTQVNFMSSQMLKATTSSTGTSKNKLAANCCKTATGQMLTLRVYVSPFKLFRFVSVSDLAPGQMGIDDMKMLEQKAQQLAAEAEQDKAKPKEKILFVRFVGFYEVFIKF